jgi:hypothetical protein
MTISTGTPVGTLSVMEDLFLEGAPYIFFQDARANPLNNPDADGFYWNLSGTSTYPVYEVGCPSDVTFTENLTVNDVLCDTVGVKGTIQQRNYVEFAYSLQSFFPFQAMRLMLKMGPVTQTAPTQKMGIGPVNNSEFYHVYAPKVYNSDVGDYIWMYFSRCQFVDPFNIAMTFGTPWKATGLKLRAYADTTKPEAQRFGMWGRSDLSVVV